MSVALQIALALGSVGVLLALMAGVRRVAERAALSAEVQRKLVHVGTGLYALSLPALFPDRWPVYMLIGLTLVAMVILRLPQFSGGLGSAVHGVERRSYGDFLLAISVGVCFFLADGVTLYYVLPIAVLTLADAAAALAGTTYGTRRFTVEDGQKSIEGTVVFFVITLLIALICLMFLSDFPPVNILALAVTVAAFGTLVEAQSWRGFDNLFLPLGLLVFLSMHGQSSLTELLGLAGVFLLAIAGFRVIGPRIGLSTHAARVYVVAIFLIFAVTAVQNAVLPVLVLLTHAWAGSQAPGADRYGELDVVAALALFSFGWLALGTATGWNAVQFYGLTSMGLVMGLATLALRDRLIWLALVAPLLLGLRAVVTALNPEPSLWAEPLWPLAALCLVVAAGAVLLAREAFAKDRMLKLTLVSLALPLGYYAFAVLSRPELGRTVGLES
jgi:phytol kinase